MILHKSNLISDCIQSKSTESDRGEVQHVVKCEQLWSDPESHVLCVLVSVIKKIPRCHKGITLIEFSKQLNKYARTFRQNL